MILPVEDVNVEAMYRPEVNVERPEAYRGRNGTVAMEEVFGIDSKALQELHIQREMMDCPPFNAPMKKLVDAFKGVERGKVVAWGTGVWKVQGSQPEPYTVTVEGCTCKANQHSQKSRWSCWHTVAAELYTRWQRAMQPTLALPLPPVTIDERLAAPAPVKDDPRNADRFQAHLEGQAPGTHPHECRACGCGWVCRQRPCAEIPELMCPDCVSRVEHETILDVTATKETGMATPRDDEYIPEPQTADAATAPRVAMPTVVPQEAPVAALVRLPETTLAAVALEASLEEWGKQRKVITRYIRDHFVEGVDYYTLKVGGRDTKPTLGKSGSEKFLSLFQLQASFRKDEDTWEMLGRPQGVLCFVCTLHTRSGEVIGEGRGCRDLKKDGGDPNKAVKMASKSACVDAILRTGALSDAFTQDLGEEPEVHAPAPDPAPAPRFATTDEEDRKAIVYYLRKLYGMGGASKEQWAAAVLEHTGLRLVPEHYREIVRKLRALMDEAEAALDGSPR